jgi:hypothetical protein
VRHRRVTQAEVDHVALMGVVVYEDAFVWLADAHPDDLPRALRPIARQWIASYLARPACRVSATARGRTPSRSDASPMRSSPRPLLAGRCDPTFPRRGSRRALEQR